MITDQQVEAACIRFYGDDYWNCVVSTAFQEQERNRMRAALAAAAGVEWQPIETAPKGELILYFPEVKSGRNNKLHAMIRIGYVSGYPFRPPTHWRPLPAPPAGEGRGDAE